MPRFLCCHKSTPERILGGRIAESWLRADERGGRAMGHMRQRQRAEAMRPVARTNGGAGLSASQNGRAEATALFQQSLSLPTASAKGRAVSREPARCFVTDLRYRGRAAPAAAGYVLPPACRVSPRCGVFFASRASQESAQQRDASPLFANRRASMCPLNPRSMAGLNRAGGRFNAGRRRFSPMKFFLTKNPLPIGDRPDRTRLWAPSLPVISPCVQLVARFSGRATGPGRK
ncbi:conserved hypothetical protein [Burkholderia sp. 8Y]|nr:conserved hypothetical protein [Burkholderia sp. 8Y]